MPPSNEPVPVENLEGLLAQAFGSGLLIKSVDWRPLTDPGENYGSVILAINLAVSRNGKAETLNLVAKLPPATEYFMDLFNTPLTFRKELRFYSDLIPAFIDLQLESGIKQEELSTIAPRYYGGRMGLQDPEKFDRQAAIIMENLKYTDYVIQDRISGFDRKHLEFATSELARLHALTIALKMKKSQFFQKVAMPILVPPANEAAVMGVRDMVQRAFESLKSMDEATPYIERIDKTIQYGYQTDMNPVKPEEPWATFVHNDFWVNNMMFKYDDNGNINDMKIVDFQLCIYDYGINDLVFFLMSSARNELLENNLDEMIDLYYESFVKHLRSLKVDTENFPKSKFMELLNYCAPLKFRQCIMMVQVIQATRSSVSKPDIAECKEAFLNIAGGEAYKQKLLQILRVFDRKGWLLR